MAANCCVLSDQATFRLKAGIAARPRDGDPVSRLKAFYVIQNDDNNALVE
jgi:hypothetical protein